jgi:hypothetical protein
VPAPDDPYIHHPLTPKGLHAFVSSIAASGPDKCPRHWGEVLKGPYVKEWKEALFSHLDSNDSYGSFGPPSVPPSDVTVLDAVLALKHKLDELGRLDERKVRMCVNGSQQVEGIDYSDSYAPTVSATAMRIMIAITAKLSHLGVSLWHSDIKNAFQGTPATPVEGRRVWIRLYPEFMEWYKL